MTSLPTNIACSGCQEPLDSSQQIINAKGETFHPKCFVYDCLLHLFELFSISIFYITGVPNAFSPSKTVFTMRYCIRAVFYNRASL